MLALAAATPALANDCWVVGSFSGHTAASNGGYRFVEDGIDQATLVCFTAEGGIVTGNDITLVKFGESTLAGYSGNDQGFEVFVVYQLDRVNKKMFYTKTRIGTRTVTSILPDLVSSFVGDAVQVDR